jgi:hypothetical protein
MGLDVNPEAWKRNSWLHRFPQAREEIAERIPLGESLILVDQEELGSAVAPWCNTIPFLERDGRYWGAPPDDATAIQELVRLRQSGANFIVFAWPAFWWLDYYAKLHDYLRSRFPCVLENERLILFDLRPSTTCRSAACTASNSEHREVGCV